MSSQQFITWCKHSPHQDTAVDTGLLTWPRQICLAFAQAADGEDIHIPLSEMQIAHNTLKPPFSFSGSASIHLHRKPDTALVLAKKVSDSFQPLQCQLHHPLSCTASGRKKKANCAKLLVFPGCIPMQQTIPGSCPTMN